MLKSSIDLGTNTCLLLIAEYDPVTQQVTRVVEDHSTVVRLGQGVDETHHIHPAAAERTITCLKHYAERVRALGLDPSASIAVATSQARDASDGAEFFKRVATETSFRFRTLSGDDEAHFTFRGGLLPGQDLACSVVIDIGGGSTEFMGVQGGQSLNIGAVRFTERYFKTDPAQDDEFWAAQAAIDTELEKMRDWAKRLPEGTELVAVAGTATTLAAWHLDLPQFDAAKIDGLYISRGDVHLQVEELKWRTIAERKQLTGIDEGRADILLAGSLILWRAMEVLGFRGVRISTRGLRFGVMALQ